MNTRSIQRNVLRNRCIIPTRTHRLGFSTSTTFYLLNRSPKVRDNEWRRQKEFEKKSKPPPIRSTRDSESAWTKWPVDILRSAAKSGKLSISWEAAKAILDDFHGLKSQSWESLCSKHKIQPRTLTSIALILLHTRNVKFFPIAQGLLSGASVLRDPSATCILVNTGIKTEKLLKLSEPRKHLNYLVSQKCPTALFLQGQIFEKVGRNSDALEMYKKSVDPSNIHYDPAESINFTIGDAWRGIYRMEINNEIARAESALRKAAITYDDPLAYYHLAVGFTPKSVNEYPLYLLKAASSGNPEAADLLGTYYFKQSQGCKSLSSNESLMEATTNSENILITRGSDPVPPEMAAEKQNLAEEWFKIGAESNIESSQVHLAILSLKAGNLIQGLSWFEKVSISKKWVKTATWFRRQCESGKVDFMLLDVERLHNREDGH